MANLPAIDDEINDLNDILSVVTYGHLKYSALEQELRENVSKLLTFYKQRNPKDLPPDDNKLPFQYRPENESLWEEPIYQISQQLSSVWPVIMTTWKDTYRLELPTPPLSDARQMMAEPSQPIFNINTATQPQPKQDKTSFLSLFRAKMPERLTPFKLSVNPIQERLKKQQDYYDYIEFHSFGPDWIEFMEPSGVQDLVDIERTQFKIRIASVATIVSEGYELIRSGEKDKAVQIIGSSLALGERHANRMI